MPLRKLLLVTSLLFALPTFASVGLKTQWDARTTGSATNGGGFDGGVSAPGTDESQGAGTAVTITLTGTNTGTSSPAITATTHGPGNIVNITGGTGCTVGRYEIQSQSSGTATFDHNMGSSTDACTGTLGGSLDGLYTALVGTGNAVTGNIIWVQSGTNYVLTATQTVGAVGGPISINGYATTHGDGGGPAVITTATNSVNLFAACNSCIFNMTNLTFSSTAATPGTGLTNNSASYNLFSVTVTGVSTGISAAGVFCWQCTVSSTTSNGVFLVSGASLFIGGSIHNTGAAAIHVTAGAGIGQALTLVGTLIYNITGNGVENTNSGYASAWSFQNVGIYNTSVDGIQLLQSATNIGAAGAGLSLENVAIYTAGGYCVDVTTAQEVSSGATLNNLHNAYGGCTSGVRNNLPAGTGDVTLTVNPWVGPGTGNFTPNTTAGGGAALKAAGYPAYIDIGPIQHQDTGGASSSSNYGYTN